MLATILFSASVLTVANPTTYSYVGPSTPDASLPIIIIHSPLNDTNYSATSVAYSITIEKPSSWSTYDPINGEIFDVEYYLDNNPKVIIADLTSNEQDIESIQPFNFQGALNTLSDGNHTFEICVDGVSYYQDPEQIKGIPSDYYVNNNSTVNFTINPAFAPSSSKPSVSITYPTNNSVVNAAMGAVIIQWQYATNSTFSWVGYSLNDNANVTVTGTDHVFFIENEGYYTFSLYANETADNWANPQTVAYRVHVIGDAIPENSGYDIIAIALILTVIVLFALLVVVAFKRHRKTAT